ncbi:expressed unknown protein [Seminavis robusta]|uniref:Uncharacterized protein n=1 Tax=Seminavis robusta TaxID=568900 RepID=A0A9N8E9K3_9STRA|nr:expressed unknown protein [Seminavis robusta]|eukprot:Sro846_g210220.1 n/a (223) ;mRNA; f:38722-39390
MTNPFSKLTADLMSGVNDDASKPITDFIKTAKAKSEKRRKGFSKSPTRPSRSSRNHIQHHHHHSSKKRSKSPRRSPDKHSPKKTSTDHSHKRSSTHDDLVRLFSDKGREISTDEELNKKTSSANDLQKLAQKRSRSKDLGGNLRDSEVDKLYSMVKELKGSSEGKVLIDEFVNFQMGQTSIKPRIILDDDSKLLDGDSSEFDPPSEIFVTENEGSTTCIADC